MQFLLGLCQSPGWTLEIATVTWLTDDPVTLTTGGPSLPHHPDLIGGHSPGVGPLACCGQASIHLHLSLPESITSLIVLDSSL